MKLMQGCFFDFDYVALGHLHNPQRLGRETVRYAGSPMPYSFSEIRRKKGITVVELKEKGVVSLDFIPLETKRQFREIKRGVGNPCGRKGNGRLGRIYPLHPDEQRSPA